MGITRDVPRTVPVHVRIMIELIFMERVTVVSMVCFGVAE